MKLAHLSHLAGLRHNSRISYSLSVPFALVFCWLYNSIWYALLNMVFIVFIVWLYTYLSAPVHGTGAQTPHITRDMPTRATSAREGTAMHVHAREVVARESMETATHDTKDLLAARNDTTSSDEQHPMRTVQEIIAYIRNEETNDTKVKEPKI